MKKHAAPIIAAILLLLPVMYVGSYLALVVSRGLVVEIVFERLPVLSLYRAGGDIAADSCGVAGISDSCRKFVTRRLGRYSALT